MASSSHTASTSGGYSLYQFFAPGGVLSKTHPAYEFRRGQLQMAQSVEEALEEKRHLIVEAGTGTGKTLAYLLPVIRSGKRVIISTGTKNLQEQLFFKDVPFLEQALFARGGRERTRFLTSLGMTMWQAFGVTVREERVDGMRMCTLTCLRKSSPFAT